LNDASIGKNFWQTLYLSEKCAPRTMGRPRQTQWRARRPAPPRIYPAPGSGNRHQGTAKLY